MDEMLNIINIILLIMYYEIEIIETTWRVVAIEADSEEEALMKVEDAYYDDAIELTPENSDSETEFKKFSESETEPEYSELIEYY